MNPSVLLNIKVVYKLIKTTNIEDSKKYTYFPYINNKIPMYPNVYFDHEQNN